jgi:DinB superfamily
MPELPDLDDLRFPIGRFSPPASSMSGIRSAHIQTLRLLPERLRAAVKDLSDTQLDTPYRPEGWTVRQVVHHVADSHANCYIRFKLALTEDWPTIKTYDEVAWANLADSRWLPVDLSLSFIESLHGRWVALLESLSEEDFRKGFEHPEMGRQNLAKVLAVYDWHSRHHTAHITSLRARQGW